MLFFLLAGWPGACLAADRVFTLWPLVDYRESETAGYRSLNILGPFFNLDRKGPEREVSLRPVYFGASADGEDLSYSEYLYPVASRKKEPGKSTFQGLHLLNYDFGERETGADNEFMLFPFIFYGEVPEKGSYFAFFPFGGKVFDKFGRDEMRFTLFPLYGKTTKKDTVTTNVLWPVFAHIKGENTFGLKFWPLYGFSDREGEYRKRMWLWPIFFSEDQNLNTPEPKRRRAAFPFYVSNQSPHFSSRTVLWPFFSRVEDERKGYREWNLPWPLVRISDGEYRSARRFLPVYSDETVGSNRKRWVLWPLYKREQTETEVFSRDRHRLFYFLYSDLEEKVFAEESTRLRRVALWPLFSYEKKRGVSHFNILALLEPFFPQNESIERNWAPLWRVYQARWDEQGNRVSSFLWNLYWKESRPDGTAYEIFPLLSYSNQQGGDANLSILKGLFSLRREDESAFLHMFYLPWGIPLPGDDSLESKTE